MPETQQNSAEDQEPFSEEQHQPETDAADEPDTFDRAYVEKLRAEAAEHRTSRKSAEQERDHYRDHYRSLAVSQAVSSILADPTDLAWSDGYLDADGLVDAERVRTAAERLADSKPHLARVRGDIGQGYKSEEVSAVDLAEMLRIGA